MSVMTPGATAAPTTPAMAKPRIVELGGIERESRGQLRPDVCVVNTSAGSHVPLGIEELPKGSLFIVVVVVIVACHIETLNTILVELRWFALKACIREDLNSAERFLV